MTNKDFVIALSEKNNISKVEAKRIVDLFTDSLIHVLETTSEESVSVKNLGKFKISDRTERKGRNPKTGEEVIIPKSRGVVLKLSTKVKEAVNKGCK